jgi:putative oxidoreductase
MISTTTQQTSIKDWFQPIVTLVEMAQRPVRAFAQPSVVQAVVRLALAVPFWK